MGGSGGAGADGGAASVSPRLAPCAGLGSFGSPLPADSADRVATPIQRNFGFIEGPVWLAATSTLLFSDMNFGGGNASGPPSQIRSLVVSGAGDTFGVFVAQSGSNGLALSNDGRVLAATHDVQSLSYFDAGTGDRTDWPLRVDGLRFNSPNDLVVRSDGNVYFTDPSWQLGTRSSETGVEGFYRVSPAGVVTRIPVTPARPNGVTLSPDERTLYVGGQSGGIFAIPLDADGSPDTPVPFADGSTDGMTVDCAGNVYVTSGDVVVFDPSGTELGRITLDRSPSNVAFGGDDARTLFITGGNTLFRIRLDVPGTPY
jgi:gluconolactonase